MLSQTQANQTISEIRTRVETNMYNYSTLLYVQHQTRLKSKKKKNHESEILYYFNCNEYIYRDQTK